MKQIHRIFSNSKLKRSEFLNLERSVSLTVIRASRYVTKANTQGNSEDRRKKEGGRR